MADTELNLNSQTLLGDFGSVENKELVIKELFNRLKPKVGKWRSRCHAMKLLAPYKTASFRSLRMPKAPDYRTLELREGIRPGSTGSLLYTEQTVAVKPYGFYETYTDEELTYGFDNIVGDLTESVANQGEQILDNMCADAYLSGTQVFTANSGGLERTMLATIKISLSKATNKKGQRIHAILTPEDINEMRLKYNSGSANLFLDLPLNDPAVKDGVISRFEGIDFEEDDSEALYGEDDHGNPVRYAIFYVLDTKGRQPVSFISPDKGNGEFIAKGLGQSGEDRLNQKGSIGLKFKGLGTMVTSDECLIKVAIAVGSGAGTIATVETGWNYDDITAKANGETLTLKNQDGTSAKKARSPRVVETPANGESGNNAEPGGN